MQQVQSRRRTDGQPATAETPVDLPIPGPWPFTSETDAVRSLPWGIHTGHGDASGRTHDGYGRRLSDAELVAAETYAQALEVGRQMGYDHGLKAGAAMVRSDNFRVRLNCALVGFVIALAAVVGGVILFAALDDNRPRIVRPMA